MYTSPKNKPARALPLIITVVTVFAIIAAFIFLNAKTTEHHGREFDAKTPVAELAGVVSAPDASLDKVVRISGTISRQCPSSGCWFYLKSPSGAELKVEMSDYTPKLPQHRGHTATVEGRLIRFGDKYEFIGEAVEFKKP